MRRSFPFITAKPARHLVLSIRRFVAGVLCLALSVPANAAGLAKFEPEHGCYIGAFIEKDFTVQGDISAFEALTKRKHASYFTYVGYGQPFPRDWVDKVKKSGAAPQIAFEPNDGLDKVQDGPYLRDWARDAARARCPIFLRWASEMNGPWMVYSKDPELYKQKFRLMHDVMAQEAPNVAMVWTPFAEPQKNIMSYYPGDEYVDWVGVNIYSVYVNDGDPTRPAYQKDPLEWLQYIYDRFADRKPIHISEFAATIRDKATGTDTIDFAIDKITRFYDGIRDRFPRVKSINYFVWNTIRAKRANNDYSFLDDGRVLAAYRKIVADPYFLSHVNYTPGEFAETVKGGSTLKPGHPAPVLVDDNTVESQAAIAANLDQPYIRGVRDGDRFLDDIPIRVQLPLGLEVRSLIWQVDGRTIALTNKAPYHVTIERDRFAPGKHTVRVIVLEKNAAWTEHPSGEVQFEFLP